MEILVLSHHYNVNFEKFYARRYFHLYPSNKIYYFFIQVCLKCYRNYWKYFHLHSPMIFFKSKRIKFHIEWFRDLKKNLYGNKGYKREPFTKIICKLLRFDEKWRSHYLNEQYLTAHKRNFTFLKNDIKIFIFENS